MMYIYPTIMTYFELWEMAVDDCKLASLAIIYQAADNANNHRENGGTDGLYDVCLREALEGNRSGEDTP